MWTPSSYKIILVAFCIVQIQGNPHLDQNSLGLTETVEGRSRLKREAPEPEQFWNEKEKVKKYEDHYEADLCHHGKWDALVVLKDETSYAFKGKYFWKIVNNTIEKDYPQLIHEYWKGLPHDIDAAFAYEHDEIIFFKGSKYWKFVDKKLVPGYPKSIIDGFPGIPDHIDAATVNVKTGHIYFFKDDKYWRYEPKCEHPLSKVYPKPICDIFEGIPDHLDDVLWHPKGELYFFKGVRYWKMNLEKLKIEADVKGIYTYPFLTSPDFLGCHQEP